MRRKLILLVCLCALLFPSKLGIPAPFKRMFPVSDRLNLQHDQRMVAQQIESRLRKHRISDGIIMGAIINAYAESGLNPRAIGPGNTRGVFQLLPSGLGHDMTIDQMHDVNASTDRVVVAIKKSHKMMTAGRPEADLENIVRVFCAEIERPKDKPLRSMERAALFRKLIKNKGKSLQR
jgi:hypothetical protein